MAFTFLLGMMPPMPYWQKLIIACLSVVVGTLLAGRRHSSTLHPYLILCAVVAAILPSSHGVITFFAAVTGSFGCVYAKKRFSA